MDQNREIRFIIPPFALLLSLLWGYYLSTPTNTIIDFLSKVKIETLVGIIAGASVFVIILGFLISTIILSVLRFVFFRLGLPSYECPKFSDASLSKILNKLDIKTKPDEEYKFQKLGASATFDHDYISENMHNWIGRRWNTFIVSVNCACALVLSHFVALLVFIKQKCFSSVESISFCPYQPLWILTTAALVGFLIWHAKHARRDSLNMIEFLSLRGEN